MASGSVCELVNTGHFRFWSLDGKGDIGTVSDSVHGLVK